MEAAISVDCPENPLQMENAQQADQTDAKPCTLYQWFNQSQNDSFSNSVDGSPFQSILGISSLQVAMRNDYQGDIYPYFNTNFDTKSQVEQFLDLNQATSMAQFMVILTLKLSMSPKLGLSPLDYGLDVQEGIERFMGSYADILSHHEVQVQDLLSASSKFIEVAKTFNNTFDLSVPSLEFLGFHEYNDQLLELERSFLASTNSAIFTFKHVIHGPSPLDANKVDFLPRLKASVDMAKEDSKYWTLVKKEAFLVVDALEAAACVLENHLIFKHEEHQEI